MDGSSKSEARRARKAGTLRDWNIETGASGHLEVVRTRTAREEARHERAMDRWARRYDALNSVPDGDDS